MDVAIPNNRNLHSTITKKLQKYTDSEGELIKNMATEKAYVVPPVPSTIGIIPNKVNEILRLLIYAPT
jgi:hypothetical protein